MILIEEVHYVNYNINHFLHEQLSIKFIKVYLEGNRKVEGAALTFRGDHAYLPPMELHNLLGDGQPQARAAALLQLAGTDLHEVVE